MMRAKRWFSKTEQHNNKCLKCLRHKEGKERARIAQVTWNLAVGRVRTPSVAWSALHPQGPLLAAQVLIRSHFILLPPSSAKNDFCYTSGKALSFHSQPNLMGDRSFTWSEVTGCTVQLLNPALQESLQSYWGVSQPPTTSNSNWAPCRADKPWGKQDLDSNDPKRNGIGRDRYHRQ